jgi:hypothetical protein
VPAAANRRVYRKDVSSVNATRKLALIEGRDRLLENQRRPKLSLAAFKLP